MLSRSQLFSSVATGITETSARPQNPSVTAPLYGSETSTLRSCAFAFLYLLIFAIPWENALVLPGVGSLGRLMGLVALPVGILAILDSGRLRTPSQPLVLMALFVVWGCLTYWWSKDQDATIIAVSVWVQNLAMVWLIWELAEDRIKQLKLMQAYVLGTLISSGDTVLMYLRGKETHYQRYAGSGFDPNELGLLLALSLPVSFYLAMVHKQKRVVWVYRLQQILTVVAIGLTASRAALIAMAVALLFLPFATVAMTFRQKCALVLLIVMGLGCMMAFLPESSWKRLGSIGTELKQGNWNARKTIWSVALEIFSEHPVRGVGAGGFPTAARQMLPPLGVHNTFLSILVEEGLIGFALLLLLLLSLSLTALHMPVLDRALCLVLLATWTAGVFSLTWETRKPTWFFLGMLAAWCAREAAFSAGRWPGRPLARHDADLKPRFA